MRAHNCVAAAAAAAAACCRPGCCLQSYNRDLFAFLFVCLTAVAVGSSLQPVRTPLLLNRPQTEEWKGWMQVLFLLYHYFEARELYNAIRIFIAGYVWLTGYGNFSYYYRTGDFSIGRWVRVWVWLAWARPDDGVGHADRHTVTSLSRVAVRSTVWCCMCQFSWHTSRCWCSPAPAACL